MFNLNRNDNINIYKIVINKCEEHCNTRKQSHFARTTSSSPSTPLQNAFSTFQHCNQLIEINIKPQTLASSLISTTHSTEGCSATRDRYMGM
jgi:hypothetical protein